MQNFVTYATGSPSPPSAYKVPEDAPAVPAKGFLRRRSDDKDEMGQDSRGIAGSKEVSEVSVREAKPLPPVAASAVISLDGQGTKSAVINTSNRSTTNRDTPTNELEDAQSDVNVPVQASESQAMVKEEEKNEEITPKPNSPVDGKFPAPLILAEPILSNHADRSATTVSTSDVHSFITAQEGASTSSLGQESTVEGVPNRAESLPDHIPVQSITSIHPTNNTLVASIPLSDLTPLRQLLQHATSADECRLLLSAILTQWRVPIASSSSSLHNPSPEARVAAWLLAGRDGPIGDTPSSSTFSTSKLEDDDQVVTPTAAEHVNLPDVSGESAKAVRGVDDEELISELGITDDESEASISRDSLEEGLPPSFAKSGLRAAPVRYGIAETPAGIVGKADTREAILS